MPQYRVYLKGLEVGISIYAESLELRDDAYMFCVNNRCVVILYSERIERMTKWDNVLRTFVVFFDAAIGGLITELGQVTVVA
jgi:hypothetical protein